MLNHISTYYALKKKHERFYVFLVVSGVTLLITFFVMVFTDKHAFRDYSGYLLLFIFGGLALMGLGIWYYFKKRFNIDLVSFGNKFSIQVLDPKLSAPLVVYYPFRMKKQWVTVSMPKGPDMRKIYFTLLDKNENPIVTFHSLLARIHKVPIGFEFVDDSSANGKQSVLMADINYSIGKLNKMSVEIMQEVDKLSSKP